MAADFTNLESLEWSGDRFHTDVAVDLSFDDAAHVRAVCQNEEIYLPGLLKDLLAESIDSEVETGRRLHGGDRRGAEHDTA